MSDQVLRSKIIRLAHQRPELREDLLPLLKHAALNYTRSKIMLPLQSGESIEVEAMLTGPWAIHKSTSGSSWTITFAPLGLALWDRSKSQGDAKAFLEKLIEMAPDLLRAKSKADVEQHKSEIVQLIKNPPSVSKSGPAKPRLQERRAEIRRLIIESGLMSVGGRSGKAGEFFYPPGSGYPTAYGAKILKAPNRAISLGNREVLLNGYVQTYQGGHWGMKDAELISKITPEKIAQWSAWVIAGGFRTDAP